MVTISVIVFGEVVYFWTIKNKIAHIPSLQENCCVSLLNYNRMAILSEVAILKNAMSIKECGRFELYKVECLQENSLQLSSFSGLGTVNGMRKCPPNGGDPFKIFTGKGARYFDNVVAWPSTEPADDYTALSILVFARLVSNSQ